MASFLQPNISQKHLDFFLRAYELTVQELDPDADIDFVQVEKDLVCGRVTTYWPCFLNVCARLGIRPTPLAVNAFIRDSRTDE